MTQTIMVGDGSGLPGNCLQAATASLLDLELDEVPHFAVHADWLERLVAFADEHGYAVRYRPSTDVPAFGFAFGPSPRGVMHALAYAGGKVWDPHPSRNGLLAVSNYVHWIAT